MLDSKAEGEPCPKCAQPLTRRERSFHWRGDFRPGAFCGGCNAIWPLEGEEIEPLRPKAKSPHSDSGVQ